MELTLDKIEVKGKHNHLQIREVNSDTGIYHRRVISPDMNVSGEVQEIQDKAEEVWTDEIKTAWTTFQAEQKAEQKARFEQ